MSVLFQSAFRVRFHHHLFNFFFADTLRFHKMIYTLYFFPTTGMYFFALQVSSYTFSLTSAGKNLALLSCFIPISLVIITWEFVSWQLDTPSSIKNLRKTLFPTSSNQSADFKNVTGLNCQLNSAHARTHTTCSHYSLCSKWFTSASSINVLVYCHDQFVQWPSLGIIGKPLTNVIPLPPIYS